MDHLFIIMVFGIKRASPNGRRGFFRWRKPLEQQAGKTGSKNSTSATTTAEPTAEEEDTELDVSHDPEISNSNQVEDEEEIDQEIDKILDGSKNAQKAAPERGSEAYLVALETKIRKLQMQKKNTQTKVQRFVQEKQATIRTLKQQLAHSQESLAGTKTYQAVLERKIRRLEESARVDKDKIDAYENLIETLKSKDRSPRTMDDEDDDDSMAPKPLDVVNASSGDTDSVRQIIDRCLANLPSKVRRTSSRQADLDLSEELVSDDVEIAEILGKDYRKGTDSDAESVSSEEDETSIVSELTSGSMFSKKMKMRSSAGIRLGRGRTQSRRRSRSATRRTSLRNNSLKLAEDSYRVNV